MRIVGGQQSVADGDSCLLTPDSRLLTPVVRISSLPHLKHLPELLLEQPRIQSAPREQLVVPAGILHLPVLHDHDPVGVEDGGQAVGDDEGRPPVQQFLEGGLNQELAGGVEIAGGLVEDEDVGILQQRPRDRQPLLLPSG